MTNGDSIVLFGLMIYCNTERSTYGILSAIAATYSIFLIIGYVKVISQIIEDI
jgi:hypothetical protein